MRDVEEGREFEDMQVVGIDFLHACMVNWANDMASYLAVHEFEINPLKGDLQETPLTRLHILNRELSSQFWTCTRIQNQKVDVLFILETQQTLRKRVLWSDETKCNQKALHLVDIATPITWRTPHLQ